MLAPVIGYLSASLPTRTRSLTIDGLDVLLAPGQAGNTYGVPIDSIELVEAGPGQVSSLSFVIEDPAGELTVADGAYVRFHDHATDTTMFAGWVEQAAVESFGIGRRHTIGCTGIEVVLDWMKVPALTIAAGMDGLAAAQAAIAAGTGIGVSLNANSSGGLTSALQPLSLYFATSTAMAFTNASLRQVLTALGADQASYYSPSTPAIWTFTVDFTHGVRAKPFATTVIGAWHDDYVWSVTVSSSGPAYPAFTRHAVTAGTRQVHVAGTGAGVATVPGDTRSPGEVAILADTDVTSREGAMGAAVTYLAGNGASVTGQATVEGLTCGSPTAQVRAGVWLVLTDAGVGLAAYEARIIRITKRFRPDTQVWTLDYGRTLSGAEYVRQLTRAQLG